MTTNPVAFLLVLAGPLVLWPIEFLLPYPYLVEELFKAGLIFFIRPRVWPTAFFLGALFALSETFLYSFNLAFSNSFLTAFLFRLAATAGLHMATTVLMAKSVRINPRLLPFGLVLAVLLHYVYNQFLSHPPFLTVL